MCTPGNRRLALRIICLAGLVYVCPAFAQSPVGAASGIVNAAASNPTLIDQTGTMRYMSQPVDKADYILGEGDRLSIRVFGVDDMPDRPVDVSAESDIVAPQVGRVNVGGMSVRALESALTQKYAKFYKDPEVTVTVIEYRSQPVTVIGSVFTPGVIQLRRPTRLMEVISQAGGLKPDAGDRVLITRKPASSNASALANDQNFTTQEVDVRKIIEGQDPSLNVLVRSQDLITIPKAKLVYVVGEITRPGGYVLEGHSSSITVLQALALAGGANKTALTSQTRILRAGVDSTHRTELKIDLHKMLANKAPDVELRADDILFVPNSKAKTVGARALEMAAEVTTGVAIFH